MILPTDLHDRMFPSMHKMYYTSYVSYSLPFCFFPTSPYNLVKINYISYSKNPLIPFACFHELL